MVKVITIIIALLILGSLFILCKGKGMSINDDDLQMEALSKRKC